MEAYQQRVVDEKKELDEKITKLETFLDRNPTLPLEDLKLLNEQADTMRKYSNILRARIARFQ